MALTKIGTDGVKDDAVTSGKIPANAVGSSELASSAVTNVKIAAGNVDNTAIGNNQVSLNKLVQGTSSNDGKFLRANNGADPSFETVSIPAGTTINNNADNRLITGSGTANTLNAESDVVINNGKLGVGVASPSQLIEVNGASNPAILIKDTTNDCISYMYSQDSVATFGSASNHPVVFNVNNGEKARIDSSGNVGIGISSIDTGYSASHKLQIASVSDNNWGGSLVLSSADGSNVFSRLVASTNGLDLINTKATNLRFFTNNSERMRIDSSGNIGLGSANPSGLGNGINILPFNEADTSKIIFNRSSSNYNVTVIGFLNAGNTAGSISHNSNSVTYSTSSDYRLKENVVAISDGITRLKTLKPSRFNFKDSKDTTVDGFVAHEVTAVPQAITGTKDETEDILYTEEDTIPSGKKVGDVKETVPKYQGIDQSKIVPLLTAALQEAITKIETLETKVAALEAG